MKRTTFRRAFLPGVAVLALSLSACGGNSGSDTSSGSSGSGSSASIDSSLSGTLSGGGSSAQQAAQAAWTAGLQSQASGVTINYDPVGSGTGVTNFDSGAYAFAGTDAALTATASGSTPAGVDAAKKRCGGDVVEVPVYISPIAIAFNLKGVSSLDLDPATLSKIFNGTITTWNDPAIAALNKGVTLPSTRIVPVHRSDDSGTTDNFTDYLSKAGAGAWTTAPSETWPTASGESAEGTSGVVAAIKAGNGTIGYADDSQVSGLSVAALKVGSDYNKPSADGAASVVGSSPLDSGRASTDLVVDINRTATSGYPLLLTSYELACTSYSSSSQAAIVKGYLTYMVSDAGQQAAASAAGSAPLSSSLAAKDQAIVDKIG